MSTATICSERPAFASRRHHRRPNRSNNFTHETKVRGALIPALAGSLGFLKLPWESSPPQSQYTLVPQHKKQKNQQQQQQSINSDSEQNGQFNNNNNNNNNNNGQKQFTIVQEKQPPLIEQIRYYFELLNRRDVGMVLNMLSTNCTLHDLGSYVPVKGKAAVAKFYFDFLKSIPDDAQLVLDETTGEGGSDSLGALWHLELGAYELPRAKGVSFYKFDDNGKIDYIRESPEPLLKMARLAIPSLRFATPILENFGPLAVHQAHQLAKMMNFWDAVQNSNDPIDIFNRTFQPEHEFNKMLPAAAAVLTQTHVQPQQILQQPQQQELSPQSSNRTHVNNNSNNNFVNSNILQGRWKKIPEKSELDSYHRALDLLKLPDLFKNAAKQIDCVNLSQTEQGFDQGFATVIPIQQFQVTEKYLYDKEVAMGRRDYKSGKQFAKLRKVNDNLFSVDIWWSEPNKGGVVEEFWVNEEDQSELNIRSTVTVGQTTISTLQIYRRI